MFKIPLARGHFKATVESPQQIRATQAALRQMLLPTTHFANLNQEDQNAFSYFLTVSLATYVEVRTAFQASPCAPLRSPFWYEANKRKQFEKAQLKRQYAKLLKKEASTAGGENEAEAARSAVVADVGGEKRAALSLKRKRKEEAKAGETKQRRGGRDGREKGQREQDTKEGGQQQGKTGKWRRPEPRPDPFKAAKVRH